MAFLPPLFRNELRKYVPWWLSDRRLSSGKSVGFRYLWVLVASLDVFVQFMLEALRAPWPGVGPEAALPYIGRTRGILRGPTQTVAEYVEKLSRWLVKWARAGSAEQLLEELHEYLPTHPKVRLFTRSGICVTRNTDGTTVKQTGVAWDWDSVSDPQRAGNWWDVWIVVYSPYAARAGTLGTVTNDGNAWGHQAPITQCDEVKQLLDTWKAAHTLVRAVIWTTDGTKFNPSSPATLPDGTWGRWGTTGSGSRVAGARVQSSLRFWEPRF